MAARIAPPDSRKAALYYEDVARRAVTRKDFDTARQAYLRCLNAWKHAVIDFPSLKRNHLNAQAEYLRFVRSDYIYRKVLPLVIDILRREAPVLETDLRRELGCYDGGILDYVLFFAERNGDIRRTKVDDDYELRPRGDGRPRLGRLLAPFAELFPRPR